MEWIIFQKCMTETKRMVTDLIPLLPTNRKEYSHIRSARERQSRLLSWCTFLSTGPAPPEKGKGKIFGKKRRKQQLQQDPEKKKIWWTICSTSVVPTRRLVFRYRYSDRKLGEINLVFPCFIWTWRKENPLHSFEFDRFDWFPTDLDSIKALTENTAGFQVFLANFPPATWFPFIDFDILFYELKAYIGYHNTNLSEYYFFFKTYLKFSVLFHFACFSKPRAISRNLISKKSYLTWFYIVFNRILPLKSIPFSLIFIFWNILQSFPILLSCYF